MRHRIRLHIVLKNIGASPFQHEYYVWDRGLKCYEKAINFILRYWSLTFSCNQIIKTIGLMLQRIMLDVTIALFFFCCQLLDMCKNANELMH